MWPQTWVIFFIHGISITGIPVMSHPRLSLLHIGSWIAKELGPMNPVIPAFVDIGQRFLRRRSRRVKGFSYRRFFGK